MELLWHPRTAILLGIALVVGIRTLHSMRRHRLNERYVILFMLTALPFLFFSFWPDVLPAVSHLLRIERPTLLILAVAFYFLLTTMELLSIVSVQERRIETLTQMVGIVEEKLRRAGAFDLDPGDDEAGAARPSPSSPPRVPPPPPAP